MPQVPACPETSTPRDTDALSLAALRAYDADARTSGSGEWRFCCPLPACADKEIKKEHRSLSVHSQTGVYKCHRCGGAGKVTEQWEEREPRPRQRRSATALRKFAAPPPPPKEYVPKPAEEWQGCLRHLIPITGTQGAAYLEGRGIPEPIAAVAGVSFSRSWPYLDPSVVVFPAHDWKGVLVAAQARSISDEEKRTAGSVSCGLFSVLGAVGGECVVLTEAPIDALSLAAAGIAASALCGVALRQWLLPLLAFKTLLLAVDADDGGDTATTVWKTACAPFGIRFLRVRPVGGKDWNEVLLRRGAEAIREQFAQQVPPSVHWPASRSALEIEQAAFLAWLGEYAADAGPTQRLAADLCAGRIPATPYCHLMPGGERWEGTDLLMTVRGAFQCWRREPCEEYALNLVGLAVVWADHRKTRRLDA